MCSLYVAVKSAPVKQFTIVWPVPPAVRQVAATPAANGPRAIVHRGKSVTSCSALSVVNFMHALGNDVMHVPVRAFSTQVTIPEPAVVGRILAGLRHVVTAPIAYVPSAVAQAGSSVIRPNPVMVPSEVQAAGSADTQA